MTIKEFKIQNALGSLSHRMLMSIADNLDTSKKILKVLSKDKSAGVRWCVAINFKTPEDILKVLSKDKDLYVRYEAKATLKEIKSKLMRE